MTRPAWTRRSFLRAAGMTLALPALPSLLPADMARAAETPPVRLVYWYVPNGIHMQSWRPTRTGEDYDLPFILTPLAPLQSKVSVLSGLANMSGRYNLPGDHARGTGCFLTCERPEKTSDATVYNGISVDQVAAAAMVGTTPFPSLQLGLEGGGATGDCDSGYACAYTRSISWADATTPLPKMSDPRTAFDRLFGTLDGASADELARRRALRLSVLDAVAEDARRLQGRVGASDRAKLDQYLTGVRDVERRLQDFEDSVCEVPDRPDRGVDTPTEAVLFNEIMAVALHCDLSRVITYMFANGGSNRNHTWVSGGDGAHHALSHHQSVQDNYDRLERINRWEIEVFADFLARLDDIVEVDGTTMLDNTLVKFGSEISDGNRHNHDDLPVLLAGGGGGAVRPGRHLAYSNQEPVANLFLSMLQAFGAPQASFGSDSTGPLANLA